MFIQRKTWNCTDREAWEEDCKPLMRVNEGAQALYHTDGQCVGWLVRGDYE